MIAVLHFIEVFVLILIQGILNVADRKWHLHGGYNSESQVILSKVSSMWLIGSDISMEVIILKARSCNIVGDVHWECHVPCKLKTTSVYFDREYALWPLQMANLFAHSELYVPFQWLSKVTGPAATFLSHSVCFTYGRHGYTLNVSHWTLNNKQQINLHFICYDSYMVFIETYCDYNTILCYCWLKIFWKLNVKLCLPTGMWSTVSISKTICPVPVPFFDWYVKSMENCPKTQTSITM